VDERPPFKKDCFPCLSCQNVGDCYDQCCPDALGQSDGIKKAFVEKRIQIVEKEENLKENEIRHLADDIVHRVLLKLLPNLVVFYF